jgi:hypothetical protein
MPALPWTPAVTFNHGVVGSSPTALTKEIKHLDQFRGSCLNLCVGISIAVIPRYAVEPRPYC